MRHLIIGVSAVAVAIIWGASAYMNYMAGSSYGINPNQAQMYGAVSVASDLFKAFAAFLVGVCVLDRRPLATVAAGLILLATALWSANSAVRFSSQNIVGQFQKAQVAETITKINLQKLEIEKQQIQWLQKQEVSRYHKERKRMTSEINDARKSYNETVKQLETSSKTTLDANPHYTILSDLTGVEKQDAAKYVALFFAGLIELIAGLGWFVLFGSRGPDPASQMHMDEAECMDDDEPMQADASRSVNVVDLRPKENSNCIQKHLLDQWFNNNVAIVKHPCIQAKYAYKDFKESTGTSVPRNMFFRYMRERLPESKIKRVSKGLHYYIAIKDQAATAMAA